MFTKQLRIRNLFALLVMSFMASSSLMNCNGLLGLEGLEYACTPQEVQCNDTTFEVCNDKGRWQSQKTCEGACGSDPVVCGSGQVCNRGSCICVNQQFDTRLSYGVGENPSSVVAADLNGDGQTDLVVANKASNTVSVLLNKGQSTFADKLDFPTGDTPSAVAAADLNSDGHTDLAVANRHGHTVSVLLNKGDGSFEAQPDIPTDPSGPLSITAVDLDGDGQNDLAVAYELGHAVSVLRNKGGGTFEAQPLIFAGFGYGPISIAAADLNSDGQSDLAIAKSETNFDTSNITNAVAVLLNKGQGTFEAQAEIPTGDGPSSIAAADLNGDGLPDLAVTNSGAIEPVPGDPGHSTFVPGNTVSVLLNKGQGAFEPQPNIHTGDEPSSVAAADLNGDGQTDLAVANHSSATVSVLLNKGQGIFTDQLDFPTDVGPNAVAIADLNGDGQKDLAVANSQFYFETSNTVNLLRNMGDGTFVGRAFDTGLDPTFVAAADLNGDGHTDLAVVNAESNTVSVLLNKGDGSFKPKHDLKTGTAPVFVASADLNGDGHADLAIANAESNTVSVLLNMGDGISYERRDFDTGLGPASIALADLNGDDYIDLAVANAGNSNEVGNTVNLLVNNGKGDFQVKGPYFWGLEPRSIVAAELNGDARPDLAVASSNSGVVSVLLNKGGGNFDEASKLDSGGARTVAGADLNGDGYTDLAITKYSYPANVLSVFLNRGDGNFADQLDYSTDPEPTWTESTFVAVADLNGDGLPELTVVNSTNNAMSVFLNNSEGLFLSKLDFLGGPSGSVAAADLNGDDRIDLAVVNPHSNAVRILLNVCP